MQLNFFGRDTGFGNEHTSAFFVIQDNDLVIIDCPISTFQKLKKMDLSVYKHIYVLITHTHSDHIGGLSLWVQYSYFVLNKVATIVAPSPLVLSDITYLLNNIEGCESSWYKIFRSKVLEMSRWWFGTAIKTNHSPQLENKCYGYQFIINGKNIVYSGDTNTLQPYLPYLTKGAEFYVDVSVHYGIVHLKLEDILDDLIAITKKDVRVYLMHLDDVNAAKEIVKGIRNINVVSVKNI